METPQYAKWLTPQLRAWLYGITTALGPLLTIYGIVDQATAPLWIALAASGLGTSTALMHTPRADNERSS